MDVSLSKTYTETHDDERCDDTASQVPFTSGRRDTSEYCHCNGIHLKSISRRGIGSEGGGYQKQCAQTAHGSHNGIDDHTNLLYMNACVISCLTVGTDCIDPASKGGLSKHDCKDHGKDDNQK